MMLTVFSFLRSKALMYVLVALAVLGSYFYAYKRGENAAEQRFAAEQAVAVQKAVEKAKEQAKDELEKALRTAQARADIEKKAAQTKTKTEVIIKEKVSENCRAVPVELTDELNKLIKSINE